jgi:hypothetical protein
MDVNQMMRVLFNNKKLVLLVIAFMILFPIGIYGLRVDTSQQSATKPSSQSSQPSPTQAQKLSEGDPQKQRINYMQTTEPLSVEDERVKFELLSTLGSSNSAILYESSNITVDYVRSADIFQGEIRTKNIDSAKAEAVAWFREQGMSDKGICNLPLNFYLNYDIKMELGEEANTFNPLPSVCQ